MSSARRSGTTALAVAVSAVALTACGGGGSGSDNGVAAKSPDQILAAAIASAKSAGSLRVKGDNAVDDIVIARGQGSSGDISASGERVRLVVTPGTAYLNANRTFWQKVQPAALALAGHWVRLPGAGAAVAQLKYVTFAGFLSALASERGKVTKGPTTTVSGEKAITLKIASGGDLYVATTGKPYLVGSRGGQLGTTYISQWGHSFTITPPSGAKSPQSLLGR
jgi:hypothetical protein